MSREGRVRPLASCLPTLTLPFSSAGLVSAAEAAALPVFLQLAAEQGAGGGATEEGGVCLQGAGPARNTNSVGVSRERDSLAQGWPRFLASSQCRAPCESVPHARDWGLGLRSTRDGWVVAFIHPSAMSGTCCVPGAGERGNLQLWVVSQKPGHYLQLEILQVAGLSIHKGGW